MTKKHAYLFDFDGTLVDTMGGFADIAGRVISDYHPEITFKEARKMYLDTSGAPFFQQLEIILPGDPTNQEKAKIFEETKKKGFFLQTFSDDVKTTITTLREKGHTVGVSSNNYQHLIDEFIAKEELCFDIVLGFKDGFEKGKDHFEHVLKKFSVSRNELIFVGDSIKDAEKAISNGVHFIGLCGTFKRKDFLKIDINLTTINKITELLSI